MESSHDDDLGSLSLAELFSRALAAASKANDQPTNDDDTQSKLRTSHDCLVLAQRLLRARGVFSSNEQLEDVTTHGLAFMFVDFVAGEVVGRLRTTDRDDRLARLAQAKDNFASYIRLLDNYSVVPEDARETLARSGARDPAKRREEKIRQYRWEKEVRSGLEALASKRSSSLPTPANDFTLILSLIPKAADLNEPTPDSLRTFTVSLLSLLYAQSLAQLESIGQEVELLRSMPSEVERPRDDVRERERDTEEVATWRLDSVDRGGPDGKGELMDSRGKPLRPFTILPAGGEMDTRQRLAQQVFRESHRLPTMSIDEYLQNEFDTPGRVITGGGKASEDAPTSTEILQLASEADGTVGAEIAEEQKRQKEENWAIFTDENEKGAGNKMTNRG